MKKILKIGLIGLTLMLVTLKACSLSGGPIDGQVLDESTGKPVADAIVVVTWTADHTNLFASGNSVCYHVETARSDANGKYHIPGWSHSWSSDNLLMSIRPPQFEAYKPGYTRPKTSSDKPETVLVAPFKGTKDEYSKYLGRVAGGNGCSGAGESGKNLYRLYVALASDAKAIAEIAEQEKMAESFAALADEALVNFTKPIATGKNGLSINVNPEDSYRKEELLK